MPFLKFPGSSLTRLGRCSQAPSEDVELGEVISSFATLLGKDETGSFSRASVCISFHAYIAVIRAYKMDIWQCNALCASGANETDVKARNPKCGSCREARVTSYTTRAASSLEDVDSHLPTVWQVPYPPLSKCPHNMCYYCVRIHGLSIFHLGN